MWWERLGWVLAGLCFVFMVAAFGVYFWTGSQDLHMLLWAMFMYGLTLVLLIRLTR